MKEHIENLIKKQLDLYKSDQDRMLADYNAELQHVDDYNGRQILELIQNADDVGSDSVLIRLDTKNNTLVVSNSGNSFSAAGYKSLMLSNLSSKTKEQFIGNKGLGFRSIISWSNKIVVRSNGIDVTFSDEISRNGFEYTFDETTKKALRLDHDLSDHAIPWAVLATPEVSFSPESEWATEIIISYNDGFIDDIHQQLNSVNKEVLLFLNNISLIEIRIDDEVRKIEVIKNDKLFTIEDESWEIYDSGVIEFPDSFQDSRKRDKQHYNIKIALPSELASVKQPLFSFFPTKIELDFPFVLHATFDLDSSRNQLNDTPKNRFVLSKVIELIVFVAKDCSVNKVAWKPLKILSFSSRNPVLEKLGFYTEIEACRKNLALYPCVDNTYRKLSDVAYKSDEFSSLLVESGGEKWFPNMVLPIDEDIRDYEGDISNDIEDIVFNINLYSEYLTNCPVKFRVELIYELSVWREEGKYNLLTNNGGRLIDASVEDVFTPLTSKIEELALPGHVNIEFINSDLYLDLLQRFSIDSDQKPRDLQGKLKGFTSIQSYEPAELITKIVTSTNSKLKIKDDNSNRFVVDMVTSLFHIYLSIGAKTPFPKAVRPFLINVNGEPLVADELHFSYDYISGKDVMRVFSEVYGKDNLLADRSIFGLDGIDENSAENFFSWIGVNEFVKYEKVTRDEYYIRYIHSLYGRPVNYREPAGVNAIQVNDARLEAIHSKCSLEEIVFWLCRDKKANSRITGNDQDAVAYSLYGESWGSFQHSYVSPPSYISYQLSKLELFTDYWITDDRIAPLVNEISFDYEYFSDLDISRAEIDLVLLNLGAKEKFEDLSLERINSVLRSLSQNDPKGRNSQKIYKLALGYYKNNKEVSIDSDILLYAKTNNGEGYFQQADIYYTDNIRLPSKLIENHPILNFPKRSGSKQVSEFFNVRSLNEIVIDVVEFTVTPDLNDSFTKKFNEIKPYILAYRLESMQKNKSVEARSLTAANIVICNSVLCSSDGKEFYLEENDYVEFDSKFYIRVGACKTLQTMIRESNFGDTFTEIICSAFKVNEHRNEFRTVLREDLSDTEHSIGKEFGYELLSEARELLGISDYFSAFWKGVLDTLEITCDYAISIDSTDLISNDTGVSESLILSLPYENILTNDKHELLKVLEYLNIGVQDFNRKAYYKFDFTEEHVLNISVLMHKYRNKFESLLFEKLNGEGDESRERYLELIGFYEYSYDWAKSKAVEFRDVYKIEYTKIIEKFVMDIFSISLNSNHAFNAGDIDEKYKCNMAKLNIENLDIPEKIRSLLYFDSSLERVKVYLDSLTQAEVEHGDSDIVDAAVLPDFSSNTVPKPGANVDYVPKKPGKHSSNRDASNRLIGLKAEKVVRNALIKKYGIEFVRHVSIQDDALGYDIRYSPDEGNAWKYVEVKRCTGSMFHLTRNEMRVSQEHKKNYELFVSDQ